MVLKRTLSISLILVTLSLVVFTSCNSGTGPAGQSVAGDTLNKDTIAKDVKAVIYPLPTPFEMTQMLSDLGANYVAKSLNPADKAEKYFTEKSKAINLGIYGADLTYAATYNKNEDIKIYLKALKTLIDELGVSVDYSYLLSDEFKEKANNKDSLTNIITNTFFDTYSFLSEKSNPDLAVMMVSGMWIELMHIATNISEDTYHSTPIVRIIGKQRDSYMKLLGLLNSRNTNADIKDIEDKLLIIKPAFDKIDKGLTEQDYKLILQTIEEVRAKFVS